MQLSSMSCISTFATSKITARPDGHTCLVTLSAATAAAAAAVSLPTSSTIQLTSLRSRLILRGLELDKLTVLDSKAQSSTVSMLHVLVGAAVLTGGGGEETCCVPIEALAEMCVCTARC